MQEVVDENKLKELITSSSKILLVTRERPSVDGLASMLALGSALKENQKVVFMATSGDIPEAAKSLPGIENISKELSSTNLVISFDYIAGQVEKVSYNIDGDHFNLILTGRDSTIDPDKIEFKEQGPEFDIIMIVDTPKVEYLGKLLEHDRDLYSKLPTVNIDYHASNTGHSSYKWVSDTEVSTAEIVFDIISTLGWALSKESAELLLAGIKDATGNFAKNVSAETLERAAACMRALGQVEKNRGPETEGEKEETPPQSPDESWFAPKIYRSSKIIE